MHSYVSPRHIMSIIILFYYLYTASESLVKAEWNTLILINNKYLSCNNFSNKCIYVFEVKLRVKPTFDVYREPTVNLQRINIVRGDLWSKSNSIRCSYRDGLKYARTAIVMWETVFNKHRALNTKLAWSMAEFTLNNIL